MKFRPCIDLRDGRVTQIVGSSLSENQTNVKVNFISEKSADYFAKIYKCDNLRGGHIIKLGNGNDAAAVNALKVYPQGLQIGGGITLENGRFWLESGAEKIIITSTIFYNQKFSLNNLINFTKKYGKEKIVIDLSCKFIDNNFVVMMNKWQTPTDLIITREKLDLLANYCSEFLVHGIDVEGKQAGIDEQLIQFLAKSCSLKMCYAGGISSTQDIEKIAQISNHKFDFTVGSALDIFGGNKLTYEELVRKY